MPKRLFFLLLAGLVLVAGVPQSMAQFESADCPEGSPRLVVAGGASGAELRLLQESLARYMRLCPNVTAVALESPELASNRLAAYQRFLNGQSSQVDIYMIDVIWPALIADYLHNLYNFIPESSPFVRQHFSALIANNTVDDALVALPWYADMGVLYYRTDLLERYGLAVPQTWRQLEEAARIIQEGERTGGNNGFYGYIWPGARGESLTSTALEWQFSQGGGEIITPDGDIDVNNTQTAEALERAANWLQSGGISPADGLNWGAEDTRAFWERGNAAFMRNWTYVFALSDRGQTAVRGRIGVAPLPAGDDGVAATLGGWQLGVSRFSANPEAAVSLVLYLTSAEEQAIRAIDGGYHPTIPAVYANRQVLNSSPTFAQIIRIFDADGATARPSTVSDYLYNDVSRLYSAAVYSVLTGQESAEIALDDLEFELEDILIELGF